MNNDLGYKELSSKSKEEIMELFKTNEDGLNINAFRHRLDVLILFLLATIDFITDDKIGAFIILGITLISVIIRFSQDWSTYKFNEKLKEQIRIFTDVIREGKQKEIRQEKVVYGDIITLSAGSVIPADLYLFESKDLFINQSAFTGESAAVEKNINT